MSSATTTQPMLSFPRDTFAKLSPHPYLLAHLKPTTDGAPSQRANGRAPTEFRTPHVNTGSLTHAEGSAVVRTGDTTVVCGVRGELLTAADVADFRGKGSNKSAVNTPGYNEAKELDLIVPNIEIATGCSPAFLPGQPPSMLAQSLSTRLYSLLHSSRLIDVDDLKIWYQPPRMVAKDNEDTDMESDDELEVQPEVKAFWTLYIDILFISLDGNPFDVAWAAVVSALKDVRLPKAYWDTDREMILCSEDMSKSSTLQLHGMPLACSYAVFKGQQRSNKDSWVLADPDSFEETLCDESATIILDCCGTTKILGISKTGGTVIDKAQMAILTKISVERWSQWQQALSTAKT